MKQLLKQFAVEASFDAETVQILGGAFDDAWKAVQASGAPFADARYTQFVRETLAKHIIEMAKAGERDRRRLSQDALLKLSRASLGHR